MSMLSKSRLGVCQLKLECGGSKAERYYETEDAVGREEGSLTDICTHDEGKEIARGEARATTRRGLLGISLVVITFTSEVGRFSHHRLRPARSTRGLTIFPLLQSSQARQRSAKHRVESAWFNPLGAKYIDAYIILSALVT